MENFGLLVLQFAIFGEEGSSGFLEKEIVANTNQIYSPNSDFKPGTVRLTLGSSESSRIIKQALLEQKKE